LQTSKDAVSTDELLKSFGWMGDQINTQHDITEFNLILSENLESKMEQVQDLKGTYSKIFEGEFATYYECINVNYTGCSKEKFN